MSDEDLLQRWCEQNRRPVPTDPDVKAMILLALKKSAIIFAFSSIIPNRRFPWFFTGLNSDNSSNSNIQQV